MLEGACYLTSCFLLLQERMDVEMASGKFTGKTALFYWVSRNKKLGEFQRLIRTKLDI